MILSYSLDVRQLPLNILVCVFAAAGDYKKATAKKVAYRSAVEYN
jgi:hypothetical protein